MPSFNGEISAGMYGALLDLTFKNTNFAVYLQGQFEML